MKVALFFGSFNPITIGHCIIANYVINEGYANNVWFVVSPHNPFKEEKDLLDFDIRCFMVKTAIDQTSGFNNDLKVCEIEKDLPKPSYSITTLNALTEKYPNIEFIILIGTDILKDLSKWKNSDEIIRRFNFLVYPRNQFPKIDDFPDNFTYMNAPVIDISSTMVRQYIKNKKNYYYLCPSNVSLYIKYKKLYT